MSADRRAGGGQRPSLPNVERMREVGGTLFAHPRPARRGARRRGNTDSMPRLRYVVDGEAPNRQSAASETALAASVVQASGFRRDVTVFRLNAACAGDSGLEPAF